MTTELIISGTKQDVQKIIAGMLERYGNITLEQLSLKLGVEKVVLS